MSKRIFHITVYFDRFDDECDLSPAFDIAKDWLRYAPNCWLVVTDEEGDAWRDRLKKITKNTGNILLIEITNSSQLNGFLRDSIWKWLKKNDIKIKTW